MFNKIIWIYCYCVSIGYLFCVHLMQMNMIMRMD